MSIFKKIDFKEVLRISRDFAGRFDLDEDRVDVKAEAWFESGKDCDKEDGAALLAYLSKVFHESL